MTAENDSTGGESGATTGEYDDLIPVDAAVEAVQSLRGRFLETRDTEAVSLGSIGGRVLAESVVADVDQPAADIATMDGFAFDATDEYPLEVRTTDVFPEDEPPALAAGQAIPIATGGALPAGANAVLKQEEATVDEGRLTGSDIAPGTYVYRRASNVASGETLFEAGERLSPKDAILLGDLGYETVAVRSRLSTAVLATGTEIHEGVHRDLDSAMLAGLVRSWGHEATYAGSVPDDYETVRSTLASLAADHDVVLSTGGTSVGKKDYVVAALEELGEVLFHRVRLRPGKPIAVADLPEFDAVAIAIPGKPIGAHAVTTLVARPFFTGESALPTLPAVLTHAVDLPVSGFEYAIPVTLADGTATPLGQTDSALSVYERTFDPSVLSSSTRASRADGFVLTDSDLPAEEAVDVVPYSAVER